MVLAEVPEHVSVSVPGITYSVDYKRDGGRKKTVEEEGGDLIANQRAEAICVHTVAGGSIGIMPAGTVAASKINTFVAEVMLSEDRRYVRGGDLLRQFVWWQLSIISGPLRELDVVGGKEEL